MWFLRIICRIIFKIFVPVTVLNKEKMPSEGACVVAPNHETMMDMFMIGYKIKRKIKWMAKQELFKFKPFGWLIKKCGAYPVKRDNHDVGGANHTVNLLKSGEAVGIFPQGTRSKGRGLALVPKPGFIRLALDTDAKIVPIAIWGKIRIFGRVYVKFGDPVDPAALLEGALPSDKEAVKNAAVRYMENVYAMMEITDEDRKG
ncbi:MAG: 1-acyl-sn-glycerol-3-phosphate acyltransferase [Clostridia bacterium]|nr:1-acyl-sn-glycerol-3-phosphate acyltransferase [Clostridia bacterium]